MPEEKDTLQPVLLLVFPLGGVGPEVQKSLVPVLPPEEVNRLKALPAGSGKAAFLVSRWVVRSALGWLLKEDPARLRLTVAPQGKPSEAGGQIHFSISHTRTHVFCGFSPRSLGVDAEPAGRYIRDPQGLSDLLQEPRSGRTGTPAVPQDLLPLLVRFEAYYKASGGCAWTEVQEQVLSEKSPGKNRLGPWALLGPSGDTADHWVCIQGTGKGTLKVDLAEVSLPVPDGPLRR